MTPVLKDSFGRNLTYLRISITDKCNLNCNYCTIKNNKNNGFEMCAEEILKICRIFNSLGIKKIRITGGEPLIRKDLSEILKYLRILALKEITLTTNGTLLYKKLPLLVSAGIRRINVSLPSPEPETYKKITGKNIFYRTISGIINALSIGMKVKLNVVVMKESFERDFFKFTNIAMNYPVDIRFIEFMPFCGDNYRREKFVNLTEVKDDFIKRKEVQEKMDGVAKLFEVNGWKGRIGFITPMSRPFCDSCTRIRITHDGRLKTCLFSSPSLNVLKLLKESVSEEKIKEKIVKEINKKQFFPEISSQQSMRKIGG